MTKLTISIPTWNRCEFLKENILSMLPAIDALPAGLVEIFVSDNASTDDTPIFLAEISQQYPYIRTIRQPENQGANANFYTVLKEAQGTYVWLLGDDDQINPACFQQLLSDMDTYQPGIMIGGTARDTTGKRVYLQDIHQHLLSDQSILSTYDGFTLAGKMSVLIFNTQALATVLESGWQIIQTTHTPWPHLIWLFQLLARQQSILVLPYTTNYIVEKNRYNLLQCGLVRLELMFVDYTKMLVAIIDEFPPQIRRQLLQRIVRGRSAELIKILAYATFLNTYTPTIQSAWMTLQVIPLWKNRLHFFSLYLLPTLTPIRLRKTLFLGLARLRPQWQDYQDFLNYLHQVAERKHLAGARAVFNKDYLNGA